MKAFTRTRRAIFKHERLLFLALLFSCLAFGRIVSDTSWDVSPRHFIITAAIAGVFWIAYFVRALRRLAALRLKARSVGRRTIPAAWPRARRPSR